MPETQDGRDGEVVGRGPLQDIALAEMLASWPTSQWISAARAQIAVKMHRIAKVIFCNAHRTALIVCFGLIWLTFFRATRKSRSEVPERGDFGE